MSEKKLKNRCKAGIVFYCYAEDWKCKFYEEPSKGSDKYCKSMAGAFCIHKKAIAEALKGINLK